MKKQSAILFCAISLGLIGCKPSDKATSAVTDSGLEFVNFETVVDGDSTKLIRLKNNAGMEVCITNYGGRIVSIMVPDKAGQMQDVVLGFDSIQAYFPENNKNDFGATIGRYANRIGNAEFSLGGETYTLPKNNGPHCLHGGADMGSKGWQYRVFDIVSHNDSTLTISLESADGDNGFPGTVKASVTYKLSEDNALRIDYEASTDKPTVVNMTNHSYFNLSGNHDNKILDEFVTINADRFTPIDSTVITTGEVLEVKGTPLDFRTAKVVGEDIAVDDVQIINGNGFDHNFVLNSAGDLNICAADVYDPKSGIELSVFTSEPGMQLYTGNFLDGTVVGKKGKVYGQRNALCLETQKFPDAPNKPEWPSATLMPGEKYKSTTIFKFGVKN